MQPKRLLKETGCGPGGKSTGHIRPHVGRQHRLLPRSGQNPILIHFGRLFHKGPLRFFLIEWDSARESPSMWVGRERRGRRVGWYGSGRFWQIEQVGGLPWGVRGPLLKPSGRGTCAACWAAVLARPFALPTGFLEGGAATKYATQVPRPDGSSGVSGTTRDSIHRPSSFVLYPLALACRSC